MQNEHCAWCQPEERAAAKCSEKRPSQISHGICKPCLEGAQAALLKLTGAGLRTRWSLAPLEKTCRRSLGR